MLKSDCAEEEKFNVLKAEPHSLFPLLYLPYIISACTSVNMLGMEGATKAGSPNNPGTCIL